MHQPNLEQQREAMRQLDFLVGTWKGRARLLRVPDIFVDLDQTERAEYRLDGLLLLIEGTGRNRTTDAPILRALGVVSYDDERQIFRMRAFNDGRWLETDVTLLESGRGMSWGFTLGEVSTHSVLRVTDDETWTERAELTIGSRAPRTLLELSVQRA